MKEPSSGQKFITGLFSLLSKNYQNVWTLEEILQILTNKDYLVSAYEINAYLGNIIHQSQKIKPEAVAIRAQQPKKES